MFRVATEADIPALCDLERDANLVALGHIFPPAQYPFPEDDVLARWAIVFQDPTVTVLVVDADPGEPAKGLVLLAAYDDRSLRHLAVRPDHWGHGLATTAVETVVHHLYRLGATIADLWCLEDNGRARRLYEYLGWRPTADRRPAPWPPHPTEMRYTRLVVQSDR
ncbi:MAG: N-acetyltransferase family protein [Nocardioidaceae bacterium]